MIDFSIPPELEATRQRVTAFMEQFVYPNENQLVEDEGLPAGLERQLQETVKAQSLWAPNLPREWGGMGIGYIGRALVNEVIGRSVIGRASLATPLPINWLSERIQSESENRATIVHNDFKLDNLMLDAEDPAKIFAVLDWEMCTVGDPLIDVGLLLSYWTM